MTPTNVSIEPAEAGDIDALVDAWVALADSQQVYDAHLLADANRTPIRDALARAIIGKEVYVARGDDDEVVGFAMIRVETGDYEQDVTRGVVENLYVAPDHRNGGVGTALLTTAEDALANRGCEVVALEAMAANEDAHRFYQRHGYDSFRIEFEKDLES